MALAKKGSRQIEVDGKTYRWTVSADDHPGLGIVVEAAEAPAQRMVMWVEHGNVISPKLVRYAITEGLKQGWKPKTPGRELRLRIEAREGDRLLPCPCCDYRTLTKRGDYDICPVCFWEDDGVEALDQQSGPNHITLREGRNNFESIGACDENAREHVLPPERRATFQRVPRRTE